MPSSATQILRDLHDAFPQRVVEGVITPHECEECAAIRAALSGHAWGEVPSEFAEEFSGSLPLLSPEAYNAYLPVWLRAAVESPRGEAATMVPINLSNEPSHEGFTPTQARALVAVVEFIAENSFWGAEDESNVKHLAAVKAEWGGHAA
jgi:hypothetical protein